jgi:serine/threonine protein kinase
MSAAVPSQDPVRVLGRYALYGEIASGGMATVHLARQLGVVGFAKTVAVKRLHPHLAKDPQFVAMFLDEARLAARIRHPNVVSTIDVVARNGELFLIMEYVQGESLRAIMLAASRKGRPMPPEVAGAIIVGTLHGLHAAHEASSELGEPLGIVHRDVSPQNILVGTDGTPRVLDFGVAKAAGRAQTTRDGELKGKLAYMSPEQLLGLGVTRATDIFAASIVLWEALTGRRLFAGENEGEVVKKVLDARAEPPSTIVPSLLRELDAIVMRGLSRDASNRFSTAREMARALERTLPLAPASDVGDFVEKMVGPALAKRAERISKIESSLQPRVDHVTALSQSDKEVNSPLPDTSVSSSVTTRVAPPEGSASAEWLAPTPRPEASSVSSALVTSSVRRALADREVEPAFFGVRRSVFKRVAVSAGVLACALSLLMAAVHSRRSHDPNLEHAAASLSAPVATPASPLPSDSPWTPVVSTAEPSGWTPVGGVADPSAAQSPATAISSATPAVRAAVPSRGAAHREPARRAAGACDPPFTLDDNGFRHYKRECLR